jgi:integrase
MADDRRLVRTDEQGIYERQRPDGTVTGYAVLYRAQGRQRKAYCATLKVAQAKKAEVTVDLARGEWQVPSTVRFRAYLDTWVKAYRGTGRRGFRENTRAEYVRLLDSYAHEFFPERLRLVDVRPQHLAAFVSWLADPAKHGGQTLAPASIRNAVIPVRAALSTAFREGVIRTNPATGLVIPHVDVIAEDDDEQVRALSREQLRLVLDLAGRDRLLIETLASTGLRISELLELQVRDLHLDGSAPHVRVRRAIVRGKVGPPKSRHGRRSVPLPQSLVHRLRVHVADLPDTPEAPVFASGSGKPLDPDNLRRRTLAPLLAEAGVPWASFHTFRHSYASMHIAAGANIVALSRALGHHSASFTLTVYAHLLEGDAVGALDLGEALATSEPPVAVTG